DITDVNKLIIGFGIPGSMPPNTPGGIGDIFFDDIRLYLSRCMPEFAKPPMDISGDCKVDMGDVAALGNNWLLYDFTVVPEAPPTGPVLRYLFNDTSGVTATDISGNGYHGTGKKRNAGDTEWEDFVPLWDAGGKFGGCVKIDKDPVSEDSYFIQAPSEALTDNITDALTVSMWLKWESDGSGDVFSVWGGTGAGYNEMLRVSAGGDGNDLSGSIGDTSAGASGGAGLWPSTDWNHFAFIKDASAKYMGVYINGKLVGENKKAGATNIFANLEAWPYDQVRIGSSAEKPAGFEDTWRGLVDDLRIYDYGLSQSQVAYIVQGDSLTPLYIPLESKADVYDEEPANSKAVNFRDYALILLGWLDELMWP
ncbi:MAG: LamG domain-containing protein, partial [Planctomycetota bacterium]